LLDLAEMDDDEGTVTAVVADVEKIAPAIDTAYAEMRPVVLLIGRRPS